MTPRLIEAIMRRPRLAELHWKILTEGRAYPTAPRHRAEPKARVATSRDRHRTQGYKTR